MTRSKELRRIESAIERHDLKELQWAAEYCLLQLKWIRMTPRAASLRKAGASAWRKIQKQVETALADIET